MVERNDRGRQARRYFIECERRLQQIAPQEAATIRGQTIGTDGFHCLGAVLDGKVRQLPARSRQRAKMHVWSQVHTEQLTDPSSAQFRNERSKKDGWVCGEVNSKNTMGGYVGFKRYTVTWMPDGSNIVAFEGQNETSVDRALCEVKDEE